MNFKEYTIGENGEPVDLEKLRAEKMSKESYIEAQKNLVIPCQDIIIEYNNGALLVVRKQAPAKGLLWPIGGRILKGVLTEEALRVKVKEECNLELEDICYLDSCRVMWNTEPFSHGKGCDATALRYFARGSGKLKLNQLHTAPKIITPKMYTPDFRSSLHPYVQDFMDMVMPMIR